MAPRLHHPVARFTDNVSPRGVATLSLLTHATHIVGRAGNRSAICLVF